MNNLFTFLTAVLFFTIHYTHAQSVGIGTNSPNPSAKLHIVDGNRGLLIPQVSIGNVNAAAPVLTPATGLLVWNTNAATTGGSGQGFYFWDGAQWMQLATGAVAGTDDQNLTGATLTGNNLSITIENGAAATVDLSSLINDADAVVGNEYNTAFALSGTDLNLTDGGGTRTVSLAGLGRSGRNGLRNAGNFIHLGGPLIENTTVAAANFQMIYDLTGTGDFQIRDNGVNKFLVLDNGNTRFGGDVEWRDGNTGGTILANLIDDANDGRFTVRENGNISVDLDANTQFIFNEQGLDRDFRVESDDNVNMLYVNAGNDRVSVGTNNSAGTFNVQGNSYHSDDIYLRDGQVNSGDILVRIFDSGDDGIIDVYENNARNHRIHGNGVTVFNEQGNNNADLRMESDNNANMFFMNAGTNRIGMGVGNPSEALHVAGTGRFTTGAIVGNPPTLGNHTVAIGAAAPSIQFGNNAFNLAESGRLTFEENMPNYLNDITNYCGFQIFHDGLENTLAFSTDCGTEINILTMERGGDLGIATNNPNAALSVNGTANKTGGGNWAVFSDARLKKNITNYSEGLSLITQVRTVNFSYNDKMSEIWGEDLDNKDRVYQGVIAQELQQIAPDMVREVQLKETPNPEDADYEPSSSQEQESYLEVDPNKFTYALINAVKEQQAMIEAQQEEIDALKATVQSMKVTKP